MMYLVYRMQLTNRARRDLAGFWKWLERRERFFYDDLPMVAGVRWYYSVVGDVYTLENWAAFADEAAWGQYRAALARLKSDEQWEAERVTQEDWWEFVGTRIVADPPAEVGFNRAGQG
jgi:hypothetical protein